MHIKIVLLEFMLYRQICTMYILWHCLKIVLSFPWLNNNYIILSFTDFSIHSHWTGKFACIYMHRICTMYTLWRCLKVLFACDIVLLICQRRTWLLNDCNSKHVTFLLLHLRSTPQETNHTMKMPNNIAQWYLPSTFN